MILDNMKRIRLFWIPCDQALAAWKAKEDISHILMPVQVWAHTYKLKK